MESVFKAVLHARLQQSQGAKKELHSINCQLNKFIDQLERQTNGDFSEVVRNKSVFLGKNKVRNFIRGVDIRLTKDKGRGLFAT